MSKIILKLKLESMALGGEAVSSHEGKKIFVPWGVEGDTVIAEIFEDKKDYARAKILEVLEESPHRTKAPCPYFFKCGGCQWQHIRYESQVAFKQKLLLSALQRTGKIENPILKAPILATKTLHYRSKIRLQLSKKGKLGFYQPHSREVVEIDSCAIADEKLNEKISKAKQLGMQLLAQNAAKSHDIEINLHNDKVKLVADEEDESVFSQANSSQNEILKEKVLEYLNLQGKEKLLELFAGDGNFSFYLASHLSQITAVESSPQAIVCAEEKSTKKHVRNIDWIESTAHRYLATLPKQAPFDRVLLDPPRMGFSQGIEALAALKAPLIVYVSCDPATMARDVKDLMMKGYRHEFSQLIDMFPQTYHIESINVLSFTKEVES